MTFFILEGITKTCWKILIILTTNRLKLNKNVLNFTTKNYPLILLRKGGRFSNIGGRGTGQWLKWMRASHDPVFWKFHQIQFEIHKAPHQIVNKPKPTLKTVTNYYHIPLGFFRHHNTMGYLPRYFRRNSNFKSTSLTWEDNKYKI